jgi:hypothetical protein
VACCGFADSTTGTNVTIVKQDTTVLWLRTDFLSHTVTSGTGSLDPTSGSAFNGSLVPPAATFSHVFPTLGVFPYYCAFFESAGMIGWVHVVPPSIAFVYGSGCLSANGAELTLGNSGFPRIGDASFALFLSSGTGATPAYMFFASGLAGSPIPLSSTCFVYLDLFSVTALIQAGVTPTGPQVLDPFGSTSFAFPIPVLPGLAGVNVAAQGLVFDPGVPGGLVLSNAVLLVLGS